jgi:arylsulfatase A-like enzyme
MRPNIIFITLDCVRYDYLRCYGNKAIKTSALDYLAKQGVIIKNAYSHCPITGPAHLSIFTSTLPITHKLRLNGIKIEKDLPTMAEILKSNGYKTGAFIGAYVLSKRFGFDKGFSFYNDEMIEGFWEEFVFKIFRYYKKWAGIRVRKFSRNADRVVNSAISWLKREVSKKPFFMWLHFFDAHDHFRLPLPLHLYYFRRRDYKKSIEHIDFIYKD